MSAERDQAGRFVVGTDAGPGANSKYEPWMDEQAHRLALLGLTDEEMAQALGIHIDTFYTWQKEKPGFSEAVQSGKVPADAKVAQSLFKRANGMVVKSERAFKNKNGDVEIAQTMTEIPPDPRAAIHWLANRRRKGWGSFEEQQAARRAEIEEATHTSPEELASMPREDLQARIRALEERRAQEEAK